MKKGFTLIELMIVVAIIAIIAAIAIPNLLTSRMSANETTALGGLRTLVSCQAVWRQQDADGNGRQDFWCYDVSSFYRMFRADGITKVEAIDVSFAKADNYAATAVGNVIAADPAAGIPVAKGGYLYGQIAVSDAILGTAYVQNLNIRVGPAVLTGNDFAYGVSAAPALYGTSGVRAFIVNQAGTIYAVDPATTVVTGDANKWALGGAALVGGGTGAGTNIWPGSFAVASGDPTSVGIYGTAVAPLFSVIQ